MIDRRILEKVHYLDSFPHLCGSVHSFFGDPLWDTSAWLDDGSALGSTIAGLTGYRAMPSLAAALTLLLYWLAVWTWLRPARPVALATRPA